MALFGPTNFPSLLLFLNCPEKSLKRHPNWYDAVKDQSREVNIGPRNKVLANDRPTLHVFSQDFQHGQPYRNSYINFAFQMAARTPKG